MTRGFAALFLASALQVESLYASPAREMAQAAEHFLQALTPEQKAKATYTFEDAERFDWHFIPKARKGLPFKEMSSAQRELAHALLASGMSQRGFAQATTIMSLEDILKTLEQGKTGTPVRDPDLYFFTIFGEPGSATAWGWRVEGHHLALNFVVRGDQVLAASPAFFGTNPAEVRSGPRAGLRVLGNEEDLGRQLVKALSADQQQTAIVTSKAPADIISANVRKASPLNPPGLGTGDMTGPQKDLLTGLVKDYAFRHRAELAEQDLEKIRQAGWDKVHFAWAGGLEPGQGHYYRVQGPTFLLEFDNTQNDANHVHSVWRDFENDFGEDLLRKHYEEVPHGK